MWRSDDVPTPIPARERAVTGTPARSIADTGYKRTAKGLTRGQCTLESLRFQAYPVITLGNPSLPGVLKRKLQPPKDESKGAGKEIDPEEFRAHFIILEICDFGEEKHRQNVSPAIK